MSNFKKILLLGILLTMLLAAACSPEQPTEIPTEEVAVETEEPTVPPTAAPTATPGEVAEEMVETEEPADDETEQAANPEETSSCVECHTDQVKLMDTADPVEEGESENEGAG